MPVDPLAVSSLGLLISTPSTTLLTPITAASLGLIIPLVQPVPPIPIPPRRKRVGKAPGPRVSKEKELTREKYDLLIRVSMFTVNDERKPKLDTKKKYTITKKDIRVIVSSITFDEEGYEVVLEEMALKIIDRMVGSTKIKVIPIEKMTISSSLDVITTRSPIITIKKKEDK